MAILKPFKGYRPPKPIAKQIASRPYDVLNSEEARNESSGNQYSLLRIVKPEIELPLGTDVYSQAVYNKAAENLRKFIIKGWLKRDTTDNYYVYAQSWNGKTQYGIVGCAGIEDYMSNRIKKHELTRSDKEEDRIRHVRNTMSNAEPVFFAYNTVAEIDMVVSQITINEPEFDFVADDGIGHKLWVIDNPRTVNKIENLFSEVPAFYVADGHHRTAAAALVGCELMDQNPRHTGTEPYNYFMAVVFPHDQLTIIDYNRVVSDLHGLAKNEFFERLEKSFEIETHGAKQFKPSALHYFGMYIEGEWYSLKARPFTYNDNDPIGGLDVTILSKYLLDDILGIKDLRTDKRVDFVGGIRGLSELERLVDHGKWKVAFAMYPVTMKQLFDIADSGNIMPPKTTWFEPKLRSGLVVNCFGNSL